MIPDICKNNYLYFNEVTKKIGFKMIFKRLCNMLH